MSTDQELVGRQLEQTTLSPGPKEERDFSVLANRKQTCKYWLLGTCTRSNCTLAHHVFPAVVHRAHRDGQKLLPCKYWKGEEKEPCHWNGEVCGFAHAEVDDERKVQKAAVDSATSRESWRAILMYECKSCEFKTQILDEIVAHSKEEHNLKGYKRPWRTGPKAETPDDRIRSDSAGYRARVAGEFPTAEKQAEMQGKWR